MDNMETPINNEEAIFPATVVKVIDDYRVVINRGSNHKIKLGQRFLIYKLEETETVDPLTNESLGNLEIVKGTGKVTHIQEKMSTIETDRKGSPEKRIIRRKTPTSLFALGSEQEEETIVPSSEIVPFDDPRVKDKAKPI